jgi:signal transduction histidine kinase
MCETRAKLFKKLFTLLASVFLAAPLLAEERAMSQYVHDQWGKNKGFSAGPVYAITQTEDGYLWIGTESGLVRFDGFSFRLFQHSNTPSLPTGPVLGLASDAEGNLWVRLQGPNVLRYRDGAFRSVLPELEQSEPGITAMCRGRNGEVLLSGLVNGTLRCSGGKLVTIAPAVGLPNFLVISMVESPSGEIWLGTRDAGLFQVVDGRVFQVTIVLPDRKVNCLLASEDRDLWIGTDNGLVHWTGQEPIRVELPDPFNKAQILSLSKDRQANVWVGTSAGIVRLDAKGRYSAESPDTKPGEPVTSLFEDREGDLWIGREQGIERRRASTFTGYLAAEGLPSQANGPIYVDEEDRTWFAPFDGGLYWLKDGRVNRVTAEGLARDVVYSIAGENGELWIGRQRGGLTHLRIDDVGKSKTYTAADGLAQDSVYSVYRSRDGTIWAGTLSGGVSKLRNGVFTTYTAANGLAANTVNSMLEGSDGTMWFATPSGLSAQSGSRWRTYSTRNGLPSDTVNCLLEDSDGVVWIGTAAGLAFFNSSSLGAVRQPPEALRESVLGIAEDKSGRLWITTANHLLRAGRDALLSGVFDETDFRSYGPADGLQSVEGVKREKSVTSDSTGRIWFSMIHGIFVVDPATLPRSSAPALVHVQSISADGRLVDRRGLVQISAGSRRITFSFVGLSLAVPERVQFRYRLDGFDHGWSEPTTSREAVYTNLNPGSYVFRVIASNSEGLWNSDEGSISFEIAPLLWQTWWFRLVGAATLMLLLVAMYRFRLYQLTRQLNVRFEERLAERTRIAQELHDTLLQGFLSASMQLHVAVDKLPADSSSKPLFNRVLQLMSQVIDEGRNAVRGLRSGADDSPDLEIAFSRIQQELVLEDQVSFRVIVEGRPRKLHPIIRNEVYRIGREALLNAFRHSRANQIELELEYAKNYLRLLVRDDGCGIDPEVLRSGRDGHWGLSGMRERAEGIGARLNVWSRGGAGTEVELSVPSSLAFQAKSADHSTGWLEKWYPGKAKTRREKGESDNDRPEPHTSTQR